MINYEILAILLAVLGQGLYIAYRMGKFEEKLIDIEKKQDKHNNVIERQYHLEGRADVLEEQIRVANHRIEDLEERI